MARNRLHPVGGVGFTMSAAEKMYSHARVVFAESGNVRASFALFDKAARLAEVEGNREVLINAELVKASAYNVLDSVRAVRCVFFSSDDVTAGRGSRVLRKGAFGDWKRMRRDVASSGNAASRARTGTFSERGSRRGPLDHGESRRYMGNACTVRRYAPFCFGLVGFFFCARGRE